MSKQFEKDKSDHFLSSFSLIPDSVSFLRLFFSKSMDLRTWIGHQGVGNAVEQRIDVMIAIDVIGTVHVRGVDRSFVVTRLDRIRIGIAKLSETRQRRIFRREDRRENPTACVPHWPCGTISSRR